MGAWWHGAPPRRACAALVRGRHGELRLGAGRRSSAAPRRGRLRGRHAQLPVDRGGALGLRHLEGRAWIASARTSAASPSGCSRGCCAAAPQRRPLVRLYGPATTTSAAATITMNLYDPDGHLLDYRRVEELAGARRISLRTGCFCNPGAGEMAEGITEDDILAALDQAARHVAAALPAVHSPIAAARARARFGRRSAWPALRRRTAFRRFVASFRDQTRLSIGTTSFDIATCRVIRDGS